MLTCFLVRSLARKDGFSIGMPYKRILSFFFCLVTCLQCAPFRDSPFSDLSFRVERNLNELGRQRIGTVDSDGVIRIAVFADSHQNYRDFDRAIEQLNQTAGVDFVVHLGDFSNSGYNLEYDLFVDSYVTIQAPAVSVIGNHDAIGAGPAIFRNIFGLCNFWFESDRKRFIFFNSVNLENPDEFNPQWLLTAVQSSLKPVIIFSHINLRDSDRYYDGVSRIFDQVIRHSQTQMIINGHNHAYRYLMDHGTVMLEADRVEGVRWLILEIQDHKAEIIRMESKISEWVSFKN